jgi:hypothetical protein
MESCRTRYGIFGFHKRRGIFRVAKRLLASPLINQLQSCVFTVEQNKAYKQTYHIDDVLARQCSTRLKQPEKTSVELGGYQQINKKDF